MTQVAAGLGLLKSSVIDQHFDQRNRYGRLLMIVSQSPSLLGIGVDEDTAAVVEEVDGHELLRVVGRGAVAIFDPAHIVTNAHEAKRSVPLLASGVDAPRAARTARRSTSRRRTLVPQPARVDPSEAAEIAEAGQRPAPARPRHRRRRRVADGAPPAAGPQAHEAEDRPPDPHQDGAHS